MRSEDTLVDIVSSLRPMRHILLENVKRSQVPQSIDKDRVYGFIAKMFIPILVRFTGDDEHSRFAIVPHSGTVVQNRIARVGQYCVEVLCDPELQRSMSVSMDWKVRHARNAEPSHNLRESNTELERQRPLRWRQFVEQESKITS